jgi:chaperone required for assembly of F1-ATPase
VQLQDEKWNPVIAWIREHEGLDIVTTTGITPIKQSEKTKKFFESYMRSLNAFELAGSFFFFPAVVFHAHQLRGLTLARH